ncbi:unnamed protein product [Urochloa humidicola]
MAAMDSSAPTVPPAAAPAPVAAYAVAAAPAVPRAAAHAVAAAPAAMAAATVVPASGAATMLMPRAACSGACTSIVWKDFKRLQIHGEVKAQCLHCHKQFGAKSKNGTKHLYDHLKICKLKRDPR